MKNFLSLLLALFVCILFAAPVFAHSGKTDGSGGHYDHSTGEYHYHHGYPAHQHDNDDCPYEFDDNTGHNSGGLGGGYSGGSGGCSSSVSSNDAQPLTTVLTLLGAILFGFVIWVSWNSHKDKKKPYTPPLEPDPPAPPSPRMKPIRLVSPDPEPTAQKPQTVSFPTVCRPRPDPDSVLTVEDLMPPPLKKIPPATAKLEYSESKPGSTLTRKVQPTPPSAVYQPTPPKKAVSTSLGGYNAKQYTFPVREVKSSNIHSIGYSNGTLTVRFLNGREYVYFDVSVSVYFSLVNAPSVGKYYNEHIRQKYHGDFVGIKDNEAPKSTIPT